MTVGGLTVSPTLCTPPLSERLAWFCSVVAHADVSTTSTAIATARPIVVRIVE